MALDRPFFPSIEEITDVEIIAKKPGGSRGGFTGAKDNNIYIVKIELLGYSNFIIGTQPECCAVESFTAQLIRQIWGEDYAADIRLIPLQIAGQTGPVEMTLPVANPHAVDKKYNIPFEPTEEDKIRIFSYTPQAVISLFEQAQAQLSPSMFRENKANHAAMREDELTLIGKLLGVGDFKKENTIIGNRGTRKLVDCAATFKLSIDNTMIGTNYRSFDSIIDSDHGRKILEDFLNFPQSKLDALLDTYQRFEFLSKETINAIKASISATIKECAQYRVEANVDNSPKMPRNPTG